MSAYFPLFFDMQGKNVCVFGGGKIATRRVEILLEFGANVHVISPDMTEELEKLAGGQKRLLLDYRRYDSGEIAKADIVLAATNDGYVSTKFMRNAAGSRFRSMWRLIRRNVIFISRRLSGKAASSLD